MTQCPSSDTTENHALKGRCSTAKRRDTGHPCDGRFVQENRALDHAFGTEPPGADEEWLSSVYGSQFAVLCVIMSFITYKGRE